MAVVCAGSGFIVHRAGGCICGLQSEADRTRTRFQRPDSNGLEIIYFCVPTSFGKIEVPSIFVGDCANAICAAVGRKSRGDHLKSLTCPAGILPGQCAIIGTRRSLVEMLLWKNSGSTSAVFWGGVALEKKITMLFVMPIFCSCS